MFRHPALFRTFLSSLIFASTLFLSVSFLAAREDKIGERPAPSPQLVEFYQKAIPGVESFSARLFKEGKVEPWPNLGVRSLIDNVYVLGMANVDLPENERPSLEKIQPFLALAEEMQDRNPESRSFGNFRWYWRTPEVTDWNAVEFVSAHALPIWFELREKLPPESREILGRMLRRAVDACVRHHVRPDYTNIALYNIVHLILLGQAFDRPDAIKAGEDRLRLLLVHFWDHGAFEYVSPTYYAVDVDALHLGIRYGRNDATKRIFETLLEYFWTDMSMNWFQPSQRFSGAQSRTYNYLYGVGDTTRLFEFAGMAPRNEMSGSATLLNSLHAVYQPPKSIKDLTDKYPRLVVQRWGSEPAQYRTTYILDDIALGTAGAAYARARQNMVLTVDLADFEKIPEAPVEKPLPRCYFIADGREDPYGTKKYPTSSAGHNKALHMEAFWAGAQYYGDALGLVAYTPESLSDPVLTNVQSHFVFRKPEKLYWNDKPIELAEGKPVEVGDGTVFCRYGSRAFGIKVPWTRHRDGSSPKAYLIDDGNKHGVYRLTVDHWEGPAVQAVELPLNGVNPLPVVADAEKRNNNKKIPSVSADQIKDKKVPGAAFWVRVCQRLHSDQSFNDWSKAFIEAEPAVLEVTGDSVYVGIPKPDGGTVSVKAKNLSEKQPSVELRPEGPSGILELDGVDLGRPILERIPMLERLLKRTVKAKPIPVDPKGTYFEAEEGFCVDPYLMIADESASGERAALINDVISWPLAIPASGKYYLWAEVQTMDPEHDSVFVEWTRNPTGGLGSPRRSGEAWHLGNNKVWRWVSIKQDNGKELLPFELERGVWRLILQPRETETLFDRFWITTDANAKPE